MAKKEIQNEATTELQEIWVHRKKANLVTICFAEQVDLRIFPGNTRISDPVILQAIQNPKLNHGWLALLKTGAIKILNSTSEDKSAAQPKAVPFSSMNAKDAIELIRGLYSVAELEQMLSEEQSKRSRGSVVQAIEDQIKQLKDGDPDSIDDSFSPSDNDEDEE